MKDLLAPFPAEWSPQECHPVKIHELGQMVQRLGKEPMALQNSIPVIDLFAGPGGLCEGFSSVKDSEGNPRFAVKVSIERGDCAFRSARESQAIFRQRVT